MSIDSKLSFLASEQGQKIMQKNRLIKRKKQIQQFLWYILKSVFVPIVVSVTTSIITFLILEIL